MSRVATIAALALSGLLVGCADDATDPTAPLVSNNGSANAEANVEPNSAANAVPNSALNSRPNNEVIAEATTWTIGTSVAGRPIVAELYGDEGPVLMLLSAIHGDERLSVTFGERVRARLLSGLAQRAGARVFFIGAANPDGIVADSRENARGIDLNRNFPADNFDPAAGGGDAPLSEPESMALFEATRWVDPAAVVSVHCCAPTLDWDGPAEPLAETMSEAMDPAIAFGTVRLGSRPGSFGSYIGIELGRPIVTVEFALGNGNDPAAQLESLVEAIEAAAWWTAENGAEPAVEPLEEIVGIQSNVFESFVLGRSAGGLPLRVDRVGFEQGANSVVISGIDGSGQRGEWIAEHMRANFMLDLRPAAGAGVYFVTALNPDGWATDGTDNAEGVDLLADLAGSGESAEASAFWDWVANTPDDTVFYIVEDSLDEHVTTHGPRAAEVARTFPFEVREPSDRLAVRFVPLVERFTAQGRTVAVIEVASEYFEAQGIADDSPDYRLSPTVYSDLLRGSVEAL